MKIPKDVINVWEQEAVGFRKDIKDMEGVAPTLELIDRLCSTINALRSKDESTLAEKINKLDDLCEGTLSITSYAEWSIYSYGEDTILCNERLPNGVYASSLEECVDKAYKIAMEIKDEKHRNTI